MKKEIRTICYDQELQIEGYLLEGYMQPFPNHFHEYYVVGYMEDGKRLMSCKNRQSIIQKGAVILFNPNDTHSCSPIANEDFNFRAFNIPLAVMKTLAQEITGKDGLPGFSENLVYDEEIIGYMRPLHQMVMSGSTEFEKEETFLLMLSLLTRRYGKPFESCILECPQEIEYACTFMREHFTEHISLDQLCHCTNLSKSSLLRAFTHSKGVTPYRYLQTIRINEAKKLLEQGFTPVEVALRTGFADQSHFTNFFNMFIGLSPGTYRDIFSQKKENCNEE